MILHMGHELPVKEERKLDCEALSFTSEETRIIKNQIRKNMAVIDEHIRRIDLFVNHERHPSRAAYVEKLHERLFLLMDENDTFRNVLWNQTRKENLGDFSI
jgi:hypothetical protein